MYYFTNPNKFTNRNRFFLDRNTSVRISKAVLYMACLEMNHIKNVEISVLTRVLDNSILIKYDTPFVSTFKLYGRLRTLSR